MRRSASRRGSVYLAVLGAAMLVTVLGVSALLAVRVQREATGLDHDAIQASLAARSAVELALRRIQNHSNWRSLHTHDVWSADIVDGRIRYAYKFVSTTGNSLSGYPDDPIRVVGRGTVGDAVRLESVLLRPLDLRGNTPGVNILVNPSFSEGSKGWMLNNAGLTTKLVDKTIFYSSPAAMTITNRNGPTDGIMQDVTARLVNGMTYDTSVWGRSALLTTDEMYIRLIVRSTGSGQQTYSTSATSIDSLSWKRASGQITPSWRGRLIEARWEVVTANNNNRFTVDDAFFAIASGSPRPHTIDTASWQSQLPE